MNIVDTVKSAAVSPKASAIGLAVVSETAARAVNEIEIRERVSKNRALVLVGDLILTLYEGTLKGVS